MRVATIADKDNYEVRLYEFISPSARMITSFYQLVRLPNTSLGCFELLEHVLLKLENPELVEVDFIEKPYEYFLGERILISKHELTSGIL
ncbi:hypothetical protein CBP51_03280 [Cellvibrio mixtus]|uniref:Uncharacterized protein n=1 Tax=Cellvibrio mixtus TaxID=39650 RepID=A0A266Q890_9GAMM|nr:hypothetical protein [Cellvibrio mixtus]OZY86068.1 hypothetical protein CBP51_03280 [Cellvibrio mixtus]